VRELRGEPTTAPAPELSFGDDGRVTGSTGVNRLMGTYEVAGDTIHFGPAASTLRAAADDAMAQEEAFLSVVAGEVPFVIDGDRLELGRPPADGGPPGALLVRPPAQS
jgi:heat shock protein HslJ